MWNADRRRRKEISVCGCGIQTIEKRNISMWNADRRRRTEIPVCVCNADRRRRKEISACGMQTDE